MSSAGSPHGLIHRPAQDESRRTGRSRRQDGFRPFTSTEQREQLRSGKCRNTQPRSLRAAGNSAARERTAMDRQSARLAEPSAAARIATRSREPRIPSAAAGASSSPLRRRRIRWCGRRLRCRSAARNRNSSKSRNLINGTSSALLLLRRRRSLPPRAPEPKPEKPTKK